MALKAMADNNVNITCQEDARMYDYLAGQNADYIIQNVGDALSVTSTTTSLLVTLGSGEAVVQGRHITNTDSTGVQLTLPQNTTAYLVLRYDLSQSAGNEVSFISTPSLEDDDLNNAGVVRDLVLYQYITDANGVATLTDKRNFQTGIMEQVNDTINASISSINTKLNSLGKVQEINQTITAATTNITVNTDITSDSYEVTIGPGLGISGDQMDIMAEAGPMITSATGTTVVVTCKKGAPSSGFPIKLIVKRIKP